MAGSANVIEAIAEYFKTIHDTLIWPTLAPEGRKPARKPDSMITFFELLGTAYAKAVILYNPKAVCGGDCKTSSDCNQNEVCIEGNCTPVMMDSLGRPCETNNDCEQNEYCHPDFKVCVKIPDITPGLVARPPVYGAELREGLEAYYGRVHFELIKGLTDMRRLPRVRTILMELYADCARVSGRKLSTCDAPADCPDGFVCVNGYCVPIPFRIVFQPSQFRAPWK